MLEKIREFYESELRGVERYIKSEWCKTDKEKSDSVWYALQRCLGVAQFTQVACDVSFEDIEPLYEEFKEKFEKLLDN